MMRHVEFQSLCPGVNKSANEENVNANGPNAPSRGGGEEESGDRREGMLLGRKKGEI